MFPRLRPCRPLWCLLASVLLVSAEETPPGLVATDSAQDLVAEASHTGPQVAQKREAALSNSYGQPIPADAYGPPSTVTVVVPEQHPAPIYGVPEIGNSIFQTPPGAYGPPQPVVFPSQAYEGPPPPLYKPKPLFSSPPKVYGPPRQTYGPPKPIYGPPKKLYGPPKQHLPKPVYGAPFKPPKISLPKPIYGIPKQHGPPKPVYGPPKITYGTPISTSIPLSPPPALPQVHHGFDNNIHHHGFDNNIHHHGFDNSIDVGGNLPEPIYGTPFPSLPQDLKPNFPIPSDTYGPPGHTLGPIGPNDQVVVHQVTNFHYGPPQPDPNPRPPHPGIPAPPTPPRVIYDGWKPIPGVSYPLDHGHGHQHIEQGNHQHIEHGNHQHIEDEYGPPPPVQEVHINLEQSLPNINHGPAFSGAQISSGYSSVHQDALANLDLKSIVGGESNDIDQSKTVFEAHYTENQQPLSHGADLSFTVPSGGFDVSSGHFSSIRQHSAKGLVPPSGVYGVPPGSQYGAPPRPPPSSLPLPYGGITGGGHSGGNTPRHPIKFREPVPEGLIQQVGHITHHKDIHGNNQIVQGPAYLPPPIRDVKDVNQHTGNHGIESLSLSIEPSNLFSLPHSGSPINFQQPSGSYGSPINSYSVPLYTVDNTGSGSSINEVKATLDGNILANLSSLEVAAILKHCPYHEAILKAAKFGEKIPSDIAASYVASLSSLGSTLSKSQQTLISPNNGFNTPSAGSESVSYSTKDLATASHTLVQTIVPNDIKSEKTEKSSIQKGKSLKDNSKNLYKDDKLQQVTNQILQTSERIKNLSEETKQLQQKIVSTSQNLNAVSSQIGGLENIPIKGKHGSYSLQIQAADGQNKNGAPTIPHEQLLSEGLLHSILQAIEQPNQNQKPQIYTASDSQRYSTLDQRVQAPIQTPVFANSRPQYSTLDQDGLILPAGYEPIDRTKEKQTVKLAQTIHKPAANLDQEIQSTNQNIKTMLHKEIIHKHRGDISECDLKADNSIRHISILPAPEPKPVQEVDDNDVAIFFDSKNEDQSTEISVATSISENIDQYSPEFGEKIKNKKKQ